MSNTAFAPGDRILGILRMLILASLPTVLYLGTWEYAVTVVHADGTVDGEPTDGTIPLPPLSRIPVGSLALGGVSKPVVGSAFLVDFLDGNPTRYVILSAAPKVDESTVDASDTVNVGPSAGTVRLAGGSKSIARNGDSVTVFLPLGQLSGLITVSPGPPPVVVLMPATDTQILNPVPGIITGGNEKVRA